MIKHPAIVALLILAVLTSAGRLIAGDFVINEGIGGAWFNPDQDGQGFLIEVVPGDPPMLILSWYTFEPSGGGQTWLFGSGPIERQSSATIELLRPVGGVFNDPALVDKVPWGTAMIRFDGCSSGKVIFDSPVNGLSGEIDIVRITPGRLCQEMVEGGSNLYVGARSYTVDNAGTGIVTSLQLPAGDGPHPTVVLVHGSGRATRANVQFIADLMTARGWAAASYDKRGVGASDGRFEEAGPFNNRLHTLSDDVLAIIELLRHHASVDKNRLGILGISQGGWINAIVGAASDDLAFMVSVVGPAVTIGEEIFYSSLTDSGASVASANNAVADFTGFHGYDPIPDLRTITHPSLWVLGGLDRSIPTDITIDRLNVLISNGAPFEIQLYPQGNHGLRDPRGNPIPYITPPGGIIDWMNRVTARQEL